MHCASKDAVGICLLYILKSPEYINFTFCQLKSKACGEKSSRLEPESQSKHFEMYRGWMTEG